MGRMAEFDTESGLWKLSLVLLLKKVTLMILLEGFLVRLMIGITKNPFRRIINVTFLSKRTRLKLNTS